MNRLVEADFLRRNSGHALSPPDLISGSVIKEKRRILIVDNDRNSAHLVKILLEKTGRYLALEENDVINAPQSTREFRPDLILLDIMMPELDGGEIAAQIQADPELHNTPIIFLTALVTRVEAKSGFAFRDTRSSPNRSVFLS